MGITISCFFFDAPIGSLFREKGVSFFRMFTDPRRFTSTPTNTMLSVYPFWARKSETMGGQRLLIIPNPHFSKINSSFLLMLVGSKGSKFHHRRQEIKKTHRKSNRVRACSALVVCCNRVMTVQNGIDKLDRRVAFEEKKRPIQPNGCTTSLDRSIPHKKQHIITLQTVYK